MDRSSLMKILTTSNIHGSEYKLKELLSIVDITCPDIVCIVGDIFPIDQISPYMQYEFIPILQEYLTKINEYATVLIQMGDTDLKIFEQDLNNMCSDKIINIANQIFKHDGYFFTGVPYIQDSPTALKDWVRRSTPHVEYSLQHGDPILSDENGFKNIVDLHEHLLNLPSIEDEVKFRISKIPDIRKSIWLFHMPPHNSGLDFNGAETIGNSVCQELIDGVYSNSIQPLLVCSGHVHENIIYSKQWFKNYNECTCIQPGQISQLLCYSIINIKDNKIVYMYHPLERRPQI